MRRYGHHCVCSAVRSEICDERSADSTDGSEPSKKSVALPRRQLWLADRSRRFQFRQANTCSLRRAGTARAFPAWTQMPSGRNGMPVAGAWSRKPVPTPDQVRGRLFRDHALMQRRRTRQSVARMSPIHDCKILPLCARRAVHSFSGRTALKQL